MRRVITALTICMLAMSCSVARPSGPTYTASPLANFRFDDKAHSDYPSTDCDLKNTEIRPDGLYLNGEYDLHLTLGGYRAVCQTPSLQFTAFTVLIRFRAERFGLHRNNLVTAGEYYRWFGMNRSDAGYLTITFNNQRFTHEIEGAQLQVGRWTTVACAVDMTQSRVIVFLDGAKVDEFHLPEHFVLNTGIDSNWPRQATAWSFSNYSNGEAFHGLIGRLAVYNRGLSIEELAQETSQK